MQLHKLSIATLGATLLLAALVESASARSFSTSSQRFRATFTSFEITGPAATVRCQLTFEGSFHARTFAKVAGSLLGYVDRSTLGTCAEGTATLLREALPWHIRYLSFANSLPLITSIRMNIVGLALRVREPFVTCLATSTAEAPITADFPRNIRFGRGNLTGVGLSGEPPTNCGFNWRIMGVSTNLTVPGTTTMITVTLI